MKASKILRASLLGALTLTACFARVEDESVVIERVLPVCADGTADCSFQGVPAFRTQSLPLELASGQTDSTIHLGNAETFKSERELGPVTMKGRFVLRRVTVTSISPGASLSGIDHLELQQLPWGCSSPCTGTTLATYDRPAAGVADASSIVLESTGANLLELVSNGDITVRILASGVLPSSSWQADLKLEGSVGADASFR